MIAATAHIDLEALRANYARARRLAGGRRVIAVVKADAYGHGAPAVAAALVGAGCPALATWSVEEAVVLREAGLRAPILVLRGALDAEEAREAVARGLEPVLHDTGGCARLSEAVRAAGAPVRVHVEVDTGMRRMGVPPETAAAFVAGVAAAPGLALAGVFTHLARADEGDLAPSRAQLAQLDGVLAELVARGVDPGCVHALNSAGLTACDALAEGAAAQHAVRPGLLLYGSQPAPDRPQPLRPVMSLRAPVVALRTARRGEPVGYAARFRAPAETRIATLAIGYADGVPVSATGRGCVWLAGARRPLAGRISMDYVGVDVGEAPVAVGDEAVLFGAEAPGGHAVLPVDEAAEAAHTLSYELLVRVGARVRRVLHGV